MPNLFGVPLRRPSVFEIAFAIILGVLFYQLALHSPLGSDDPHRNGILLVVTMTSTLLATVGVSAANGFRALALFLVALALVVLAYAAGVALLA